MSVIKRLLLITCLVLLPSTALAAALAFPGAEGPGASNRHAFTNLTTHSNKEVTFTTADDCMAGTGIDTGITTGDLIEVSDSGQDGYYMVVSTDTNKICVSANLSDEGPTAGVDINEWPTPCMVNNIDETTAISENTRNSIPVQEGGLEKCGEWAKQQRLVIFEQSGNHDFGTKFTDTTGYVAYYGEAAPSPGATIMTNTAGTLWEGFSLKGPYNFLHHLRIRQSDVKDATWPVDALHTPLANNNSQNTTVDHCSLSWGIDEILEIYEDQAGDSNWTISSSIISEALSYSLHTGGAEHSRGAIVGDDRAEVAFLRNVFAHNYQRNPIMKDGATDIRVVNNVIYNWNNQSTALNDDGGNSNAITTAIVNNYYRTGNNTAGSGYCVVIDNDLNTSSEVFVSGNYKYGVGTPATVDLQWDNLVSDPGSLEEDIKEQTSTVDLTGITQWDGDAVLTNLLLNSTSTLYSVGARPLDRDWVDAHMIADIQSGDGTIIDCIVTSVCDGGDTQAGIPSSPIAGTAFPALTEYNPPFDMPADPFGDDDSDGYYNIEEVLQQYACELEGWCDDKPTIDDPTASETNWDYSTPEPMDITEVKAGVHYATSWKVVLPESDCSAGTAQGTASLCDTTNKTSYAYPNLSADTSYKLCVRTWVDIDGGSDCDAGTEESDWQTQLFSTETPPPLEGTHDGYDTCGEANDCAQLEDEDAGWTIDAYISYTVNNLTDGSSCVVTDNDATHVICTLAGGTENDWDIGDEYSFTSPPGVYGITLSTTGDGRMTLTTSGNGRVTLSP